jgi:hypothetical protein
MAENIVVHTKSFFQNEPNIAMKEQGFLFFFQVTIDTYSWPLITNLFELAKFHKKKKLNSEKLVNEVILEVSITKSEGKKSPNFDIWFWVCSQKYKKDD